MTNDLSPISIDERPLELASPEDRLHALRQTIGDSLAAIRRAAQILGIMEKAGDDLSTVPMHMLRMLRRINAEQLLPDVAVKLSGMLRQKVALLPLPEQHRMLDPETTLDVLLPDGEIGRIAPQRLTPQQVKQVFGDGFIRTPVEQRASWRDGAPNPMRRGRPAGEKLVEVDKARGGVNYHGHFITRATLMRWLTDL